MSVFRQTMKVRHPMTIDSYGKQTFGEWEEYPCRVSGTVEKRVTDRGEEEVARYRVTVEGDVAVTVRSQIELPVSYEPRQPPIRHIGKFPDEHGRIHHTTVYF